MTKKKTPKLLVLFDTNVLFTQVASDLVCLKAKTLVKENSQHPDLIIEWYLPEVVIGERRYQMLQKAKELLPNMQKMEKLLGHNFGVGENTLELHVDNAINESIRECEFKRATIDTKEINWENLISRSIKREPPFEANEKEKGFRDSIIAHSFLHLHKNSPSTPNICLLALISEDQRLIDYVTELTVGSKNVRILSSLDQLESLINTLISTIPENLVADLAQKAGKLFFEQEDTKSFYYKENIREKIQDTYSNELSNTILSGYLRNEKTWWILEPIFIKKERQRIHWITTVEIEFEIYHFERIDTSQDSLFGSQQTLSTQSPNKEIGKGISNLNSLSPPPATPSLGLGLLGRTLSQKKIVDFTGKEKFEIHWSTTLSRTRHLTGPKLEKILYIGNDLPEVSTVGYASHTF